MSLEFLRSQREVLAYRIEWEGRGPFWCARTFKQLIRYCRRATPDWQQASADCSSFLEHYCAHAESPYDHPAFEFLLSRSNEQSSTLAFGFVDRQSMQKEFGLLQSPLFQRQFQTLLEKEPRFAARVYLVHSLATSPSEVLFDRNRTELVDEAHSWHAFLHL